MKKKTCCMVGCLMTSVLLVPGAQAATYDVVTDFSTANNPSGVWTYGYRSQVANVPTGAFTAFDASGTTSGIEYWIITGNANFIGVGVNRSGATAGSCGTCSIPTGHATMGPGQSGDFAIFRFTAPTTASYAVNADFFGADFVGPTTSLADIVLNDSTILFSQAVNGFGPSSLQGYSGNLSLTAGDTVDFAVNWGPNNNFSFDSTGLDATITDGVPEPASVVLLTGALLGLGCLRHVRRSAR